LWWSYIWDIAEHKQEDIRTDGECCFNHIIGLPQKEGIDKPLYDYEKIIFDSLIGRGRQSDHNSIPQIGGNLLEEDKHEVSENKHLWIKKATGLGISEFMLRFTAWLCLRDSYLSGSQMCIVTGPRIELAIALIDRMKGLFRRDLPHNKLSLTFDTKETVIDTILKHAFDILETSDDNREK
jgi:hypothetical protein